MENNTSLHTTSNNRASSNSNTQVLVILVNWNGKKDTLECLASLANVTYHHITTVVVDNGSNDDSVDVIRNKFPQIPIFQTKENLGFAGGNNVAISWALTKHFEWILLLNNDTTVDPNCINAFLDAAKKLPKAKIFGAKIYRAHDPNIIDHLGGIWDPSIGEFRSLGSGKNDDGSYEAMQQVDYVCGAALFMHRSVPETIGLLEPLFFLFWEETDYCVRARRMGFEVWTAPQAKIWHKVSSSFTGGKPQMHYFWWRSRLLFVKRNLSPNEKKYLYKQVLWPEIRKTFRHYLFRSIQNKLMLLLLKKPTFEQQQKALRNKAGLIGAIHFLFKRFGNSPRFLSHKSSF